MTLKSMKPMERSVLISLPVVNGRHTWFVNIKRDIFFVSSSSTSGSGSGSGSGSSSSSCMV